MNMKRVWVTRDEPEGGPMCAALTRVGLEPIHEPVVERRLTGELEPMVSGLGAKDWLVITSKFVVEGVDAGWVKCKVAVVGKASKAAAEDRGIRVDLLSDDGTGAGLWRKLREKVEAGAKVCYPRSSLAEEPPRFAGVMIESPVAYMTTRRKFDTSVAKTVAAAAMTSPSAVEAIAGIKDLPRLASIGPTTSTAMREHGLAVWLEAPEPSLDSLAGAIAEALRT